MAPEKSTPDDPAQSLAPATCYTVQNWGRQERAGGPFLLVKAGVAHTNPPYDVFEMIEERRAATTERCQYCSKPVFGVCHEGVRSSPTFGRTPTSYPRLQGAAMSTVALNWVSIVYHIHAVSTSKGIASLDAKVAGLSSLLLQCDYPGLRQCETSSESGVSGVH